MLTSISPLGERARGNRFWLTAAAYAAGSIAGGAAIGAALGGLGSLADVPAPAADAVLAAVAVVGVALDVTGRLPTIRRQVDERWVADYRGWVYGAGFGWQIGVGLATYIMTAAVYLLLVMAALTASPLAALALGALFGLVRGLALLLGAGITSPERLTSFHRRFAAWAEPVRLTVVGVQLVVAVAALWVSVGIGAAVLAGVVAAALVGLGLRRSAPTPTGDLASARVGAAG